MGITFKGTDKVGDIVTVFPKASAFFREYNIDYCCGGDRPLTNAVAELNLDEGALLEKLNTQYREMKGSFNEQIDWREAPLPQLIDHIYDTHHVYLQKALPELSLLVTKILRAHGAHHGDVLSKVHKLFHNLKTELEQHLIKEEEMLFPLINDYLNNPLPEDLKRIKQLIKETEDEHDGAGAVIKELRKITGQYITPGDACTTYCETYQKLEDLEGNIFQHIHLENNILFPRLKSLSK